MGGDGKLTRDVALSAVDILAVGADGQGHGRSPDGRDVRVPGVLPDERVAVAVHHVRRDRLHFAHLSRVEVASPARRPAPCPHFLRCGGCDFLHADIEWQRAWKRRRVAEALGRPVSEVSPTVASPRSIAYRTSVKLVRGPGPRLGSYAPRSHDVVDMRGCRVHAEAPEAIADGVRDFLLDQPQVAFRYLLIRSSAAEGRAVVTVVVRSAERDTIGPVVDALARRPEVAQVRLHVNDDPGDGLLTDGPDEIVYDDGRAVIERLGAVEQNLTTGAFSQVNPHAAARLYAEVVAAVAPEGAEVLDLYAGSGGIALSLLAAGAARVTAVEAHVGAVTVARRSAAPRFADRFEALASTVESALAVAPDFGRVVVNPPRKGLSPEVTSRLASRSWRRLVYVSCNPDTLARDIEALGGRVTRVVPVDLFPQTRHVETVLLLERPG